MPRHRKREPILPQNRLDRLRRRLERVDPGRGKEIPDGPFLRRMWQRRRLGLGPLFATLLMGWAVCALVAGDHGALAIASLRDDRDQLHAEIAAMEAQLEAVRGRLIETASDAYVLEKTARESYGLARSGEIVYRFDAASLGSESPRHGGPLAASVVGPTRP